MSLNATDDGDSACAPLREPAGFPDPVPPAMPAISGSLERSPLADAPLAPAAADTHGGLRSWDEYVGRVEPQRGLTRLATIVDSLRTANPRRLLLVDAGDLRQRNPLTYVAARLDSSSRRPHPVAAAMNAMAY